MKKLASIVILALLFGVISTHAKGDKTKKGLVASPELKIHDFNTKMNMSLLTGRSVKYIHMDVHTGVNLGCVTDQDYFTMYLENGEIVDLKVLDKNCGDFDADKGKASYELTFELDDETSDLLANNKITAFELSGSHGFIERDSEKFASIVRTEFQNYFMQHIK